MLVPSFFSAYSIVLENRFANSARHFVKENKSIGGTYIYDYNTDVTSRPYGLTLRLAGESLTNDNRALLYTEAEKYGISHTQIHILEDATIEVRRLNETEIMRDWLATNEQQLKQRDDSIRVLNARIQRLVSKQLPAEQISAEIKAQWPQIENVTLARNENQIVLVLDSKRSIKKDDKERIREWLSVRLQAKNVLVVNQ